MKEVFGVGGIDFFFMEVGSVVEDGGVLALCKSLDRISGKGVLNKVGYFIKLSARVSELLSY